MILEEKRVSAEQVRHALELLGPKFSLLNPEADLNRDSALPDEKRPPLRLARKQIQKSRSLKHGIILLRRKVGPFPFAPFLFSSWESVLRRLLC